jgi:hypothetical protein
MKKKCFICERRDNLQKFADNKYICTDCKIWYDKHINAKKYR